MSTPDVAAKSKTPRVYSYIRFSTPEQSMGDAERRQLDAVKKFAKTKGFTLDESLCMADRGLSGFHGRHRKKGALGVFLKEVERGAVPSGSILVVENVDRLSREGTVNTLREIIFKLFDKGITLQTLCPEATYEPTCVDTPDFIALFMYIQRAHDESQRKSERVRASRGAEREKARSEGKLFTRRIPVWLKVSNEGKPEAIPEAVKAITMIFALKLRGLGKEAITKNLNTKVAWTPPRNEKRKTGGWRASYVQKILRTRAVIGEYQPYTRNALDKRLPEGEAMLDYFPKVVSPNVFYAVQDLFKENKGKGGRTGMARNLFTHLVKCHYCGGPMAFVDKGCPPKGRKYLVCYNGNRRVKCKAHYIGYDECERVIIDNCKKLRPDRVLPDRDEQSRVCESLRQKIAGKKTEREHINKAVQTLVENLGKTTDRGIVTKYEQRITDLDSRVKALDAEIDNDERELTQAENSRQSFNEWKKDLDTLYKALPDNPDIRMRLRSHLREFIDKIEVFAVGFHETYDVDKDTKGRAGRVTMKKIVRTPQYIDSTENIETEIDDMFAESDPQSMRSKMYKEFVNKMVSLRMSKTGRFIRIHFTTGAWMDIVPKGSLASGSMIYRDENGEVSYRKVAPDIGKEWEKHKVAWKRQLVKKRKRGKG